MKILRIFGKRGCVKYDFDTSFAARRSSSVRAVSSAVEHLPDTEGVTGSNPVSRTIRRASLANGLEPLKASLPSFSKTSLSKCVWSRT